MNSRLLELKNELKQTASKIREMKAQRCAQNNGYVHNLFWTQKEYRFKHITYCLARGRTMEQIEPKVHDCNVISDYDMDKIKTSVSLLMIESI